MAPGVGNVKTELLVEQRTDPLGAIRLPPEIRASDHRPGANPVVVEAQGDEGRDPAFGPGPVFEAVADRVPEERGNVVLPVREVRLGVDGDEAGTVAKDVVVVEVAVYQPVGLRADPGQEVAGERDEPAALLFGSVKPRLNLGLDRTERPSRGSPKARGDVERNRGRLLLVEPGDVVAGDGALFQQRPS